MGGLFLEIFFKNHVFGVIFVQKLIFWVEKVGSPTWKPSIFKVKKAILAPKNRVRNHFYLKIDFLEESLKIFKKLKQCNF